jgi:Txe/YoeB family toxin of Txe-Axe toxin-antitoxin module
MTYRNKRISVIFVDEAKQSLKELELKAAEEKRKEIQNSEAQQLLKSINQKVDNLKQNPVYGRAVQKALVPKIYKQKYAVSNLWIIDLVDYWRMIYTLRHDKVEILAVVLEMLNHENYNKRFGFRNR